LRGIAPPHNQRGAHITTLWGDVRRAFLRASVPMMGKNADEIADF